VDLTTELKRICGVDLTSIDGIDVITAQTIISEIGTDISKFKTEDHFASWLGLTPAKDITGGKIIGTRRRKVQNRVGGALRMAATTLLESKTYLGARYRHLRQRLPSYAAAIKAMARYLAVLVYRVLTHGEAWVDRGAAKFEQRRTEWELRSLTSKALAKGFKLVPIPVTS
jgi:transposase